MKYLYARQAAATVTVTVSAIVHIRHWQYPYFRQSSFEKITSVLILSVCLFFRYNKHKSHLFCFCSHSPPFHRSHTEHCTVTGIQTTGKAFLINSFFTGKDILEFEIIT